LSRALLLSLRFQSYNTCGDAASARLQPLAQLTMTRHSDAQHAFQLHTTLGGPLPYSRKQPRSRIESDVAWRAQNRPALPDKLASSFNLASRLAFWRAPTLRPRLERSSPNDARRPIVTARGWIGWPRSRRRGGLARALAAAATSCHRKICISVNLASLAINDGNDAISARCLNALEQVPQFAPERLPGASSLLSRRRGGDQMSRGPTNCPGPPMNPQVTSEIISSASSLTANSRGRNFSALLEKVSPFGRRASILAFV